MRTGRKPVRNRNRTTLFQLADTGTTTELRTIGLADISGRFSGKTTGRQWKYLDSGKTLSSASILVPFKGKELKAGQTYYWKVRSWDKEDSPSRWSCIHTFGMGLLSEKDWSNAKWIALEKDRKDEIVTIGLHGLANVDRELKGKKIGMYRLPQFRKEFTVQKPVKRATAYVSGLGHFDMFLNGEKVGNNFLDPGWTKYDKCALYVTFDLSGQLKQAV